jgi:hypothetical protein
MSSRACSMASGGVSHAAARSKAADEKARAVLVIDDMRAPFAGRAREQPENYAG